MDIDIAGLSDTELYELGMKIGSLPGLREDRVFKGVLAAHGLSIDPATPQGQFRSYGDWHLEKACQVYAREDRPPSVRNVQVQA